LNERYNEQDPAPQYDPEAARIRRALRAQKARRRKKMRSRRLFLLGMALILLFVLVPNLWGRAERLLYPRKYEALVDQWAETYGLDPLLVDAFIRRYGPIAVEVLGIGMNGHLGFNENGVDFSLRSHRTPLSAVTKAVQKKYFGGRELPLAEGITQGIAQIMESELVILLASGVQKAEIVFKAITGPVTNELPASILQKHPNCIWLLDQDAAGLLPRELVEMKNQNSL